MNTKKQSVITCVLLVWILLSSCAPGQLLSPTITSTPLSTATQRPTLTPTPSKFPSPTPTIDLTGTAISETMVVYEMEKLATDFCEKKEGIPESAAYDSASSNPAILVCNNYDCWPISDYLTQPKTTQDIQLILCMDESKQGKTEKAYCNYSSTGTGSSFSVPAYRSIDYYDLYEIKTGNKLNSFKILGNKNVYCPSVISTDTKEIIGDPDNTELFKQLSTYLKLPIPTPTPIVYTLMCDIHSGSYRIYILGEEGIPESYPNYGWPTISSEGSKKIKTFDHTMRYESSGHKYVIQGTITLSETDPKLTYDITATGNAFTTSPQRCTYP